MKSELERDLIGLVKSLQSDLRASLYISGMRGLDVIISSVISGWYEIMLSIDTSTVWICLIEKWGVSKEKSCYSCDCSYLLKSMLQNVELETKFWHKTLFGIGRWRHLCHLVLWHCSVSVGIMNGCVAEIKGTYMQDNLRNRWLS